MRIAGRVAPALGLALTTLTLALWRRDIPLEALARRYGGASSRHLALPDGVRLHYRDVGPADAPVLLCLHGYSASGLDWGDWARQLRGRYRLLLVDLPGHGLTTAPARDKPGVAAMAGCVAALADALDLRSFVLVGHSMGGQVAMTYAVAHPDRIAGLVLMATIGGGGGGAAAGSSPPPLALRLLGSRLGRFALRHIDLTALMRRGLRNAMGHRGVVTEALVRRTTDLARAPGHRAILTGLQLGEQDVDLLARLPRFARPTLVICGDADRLVPVAQARTIARALPRARLVTYAGVGHVPMLEVPRQLARDVADWLQAEQIGRTAT